MPIRIFTIKSDSGSFKIQADLAIEDPTPDIVIVEGVMYVRRSAAKPEYHKAMGDITMFHRVAETKRAGK